MKTIWVKNFLMYSFLWDKFFVNFCAFMSFYSEVKKKSTENFLKSWQNGKFARKLCLKGISGSCCEHKWSKICLVDLPGHLIYWGSRVTQHWVILGDQIPSKIAKHVSKEKTHAGTNWSFVMFWGNSCLFPLAHNEAPGLVFCYSQNF